MPDLPLFNPVPAYRRARREIADRLGIRQCDVRHVLEAQPEHAGPGVPSYLRTARIVLADPEIEGRVCPWWLRSMRRGREAEVTYDRSASHG